MKISTLLAIAVAFLTLSAGLARADDSDSSSDVGTDSGSDFGTEAADDIYEMIETVPTPADIIEDIPTPDQPSMDQDYEDAGGQTTD